MLVAQAALLGVILAVVAAVVYWTLARPSSLTIMAPTTTGPQRHSTARPDSIVIPPVASAASTAPTISIRVPESP
jgi:hypothetical protein